MEAPLSKTRNAPYSGTPRRKLRLPLHNEALGHGDWITVKGLRVFYRTAGVVQPDTFPLILIHGLGVSSDYWARVLPLLAARRQVYALDLPGFGRTEDPDSIPTAAELARTVWDWTEVVGLPRVHLFAHSQGAQVASELADAHPTLAASLILAGATRGERDPNLGVLGLRLLRDVPREEFSLLRVATRAYLRAGLIRMLGTSHVLNHEDTILTLERVQLPTLILRGARDPVVTPAAAAEMVATGCARAITIPSAPHALHWSRPREVARLANTFLAMVERGSGESVGRGPWSVVRSP
jgi:pimeloyl-ACP methyl ester carboxylesterase